MTISYTALQTAISNAQSALNTKVGARLDKGTNTTAASLPGGIYAFSEGTIVKNIVSLGTVTYDYRQGAIANDVSYGHISDIVLTNVPYVGPSSSTKVLVPFTLIWLPDSTTTVPTITSVNGTAVSFNKIDGSGGAGTVSNGDRVVINYRILIPNTGGAEVYITRNLYL